MFSSVDSGFLTLGSEDQLCFFPSVCSFSFLETFLPYIYYNLCIHSPVSGLLSSQLGPIMNKSALNSHLNVFAKIHVFISLG